MVTRVNSASITGNATSSPATITIPAGTGIQAGDLIIISTDSSGVATPTVTVKDSVNNVNFTQLLQTLALSSANRYLTSFYYQTPQAIADSSTITVTSSGATQLGGAVDIFRGCSGSVDQAAVGQTDAAGTSQAAPALGANATAGALVMTMLCGATGTITAGSPFSTGSTDTTCRCGNGYVLGASGSSTYASTWTQGTSAASAVQTVSFSTTAAECVQSVAVGKATGATRTVNITTTAGNILVCSVEAYNTGNNPLTISSVADSAGNVWRYSTAANSQSPPVGSSYDSVNNFFGLTAIAVCLNADQPSGQVQAVTSVTITYSNSLTNGSYAVVNEFSGMPSNATIVSAGSTAPAGTATTSLTTPSVQTGAGNIVVAATAENNSWTSVGTPFTLVQDSAWDVTTSAGTVSCTFSTTFGTQTILGTAIVAIGVPHVFTWPQPGARVLARRTRTRGRQQQLQPSVPGVITLPGSDTLSGAGSIGTPAVIQGSLGTALPGTSSLSAPDVIQGDLGTALSGAASLNAPDVIQGAPAVLSGTAALATAETLGAAITLGAAGLLSTAEVLGSLTTLGGTGTVSDSSGQGSGSGLGGQGSVPGPDVIQGVLGTSLAGAGSVTASGSNLGPTFSGPLHIILPGAWARLTTGAFTLTVPLPALSLAAMAGTSSTFTITLPKPALGWTGRDYHSVVQLKVPLPKTALTGKVTHNPLAIKIPVPAAALAGKLVHDGPLTIQLGKHRSVPRPAIAERAVTETSNPGYTTVAAGQHAPSSRPVTGQATATGTADSAATPHGVSGQPRHPQVS